MMHRAAAAAAVASLGLSGAALSQSDVWTGDIYDTYSIADLESMIAGLGYSYTALDATSFEVTTSTGFLFYVYGVQCDEASSKKGVPVGHCAAMEISTSWTIDADKLALVKTAADDYNEDYVYLKTWVDDEGALHALRYAITSGGVTWTHLQNEISEYAGAVDYFIDTVNTEAGTDLITAS